MMKNKALAAFMPDRGTNTILELAANALGIPLEDEQPEGVVGQPQRMQGVNNNRLWQMQKQPRIEKNPWGENAFAAQTGGSGMLPQRQFTKFQGSALPPKFGIPALGLSGESRQSDSLFGNGAPVMQAGYGPQTDGYDMEPVQRQFAPQAYPQDFPQRKNNPWLYERAPGGNEAPGFGGAAGYPQMAQSDEIGDLMKQLGIGGSGPEQVMLPTQNVPIPQSKADIFGQPQMRTEEKKIYNNDVSGDPDMTYWQPLIDKSNMDYNFIPFNMQKDVQNALIIAAEKYSIDRRALETMAQIESTGGKRMNNGAAHSGLMQLGRAEAKEFGVTDRSNVYQSADGGAQYWLRNAKGLERNLGIKPDDWMVYLAHQQGLKGATQILSRPNDLMTEIRGKDAYKGNVSTEMGKNEQMTGGQFADYIKNKWDGFYYKDMPQPLSRSNQ